MSETGKNKPPAGWYPKQGQPGKERYWDGAAWGDEIRDAKVAKGKKVAQPEVEKVTSPGDMIGVGIVILVIVGFVGSAVAFQGTPGTDRRVIGIAILALGGLLGQIYLLIGVIAKGVEIGNRWSRD